MYYHRLKWGDFLKETEYTYAVAYMRTLENKMLTQQELDGLLMSEGVASAVKLLTDKGYGRNLSGNETVDELLKSELEKVWSEAREVCPDGAPLDVILYQNDFHNLKTVLKSVISDTDWRTLILRPSIADPDEIATAIKSADFSGLPKFMRDVCENAYRIIAKTHDGQMAEVYIDKSCLEQMKIRADKEKSEFLSSWVDLNILIANMKTAARAVGRNKDFIKGAMAAPESVNTQKLIDAALISKQAVCEAISEMGYPKAAELLGESFSAFEMWCDNKKMEYIKKAKLLCFGFEPILAFLIGKEFELQAVRIILSGKQNGVPNEIIKERLRDMYV